MITIICRNLECKWQFARSKLWNKLHFSTVTYNLERGAEFKKKCGHFKNREQMIM